VTRLSRQSLALVLTTQKKQEKMNQKHKKLALGRKNTLKTQKTLPQMQIVIQLIIELWKAI